MTVRLMIKDSALSDCRKEGNRLKLENKNLFNKYLQNKEKLEKATYINYILGGFLVLETLLIIKLL
jgi:hypothetical protein